MNVLSRIYHFIQGPNLLHPDHWNRAFPRATFRTLTEADIPQCLEIYRANEKDRFPEGEIAIYEQSLTGRNGYYLVAEEQDRIVASAGVGYWGRREVLVFCYGLVHPEFQGKGYGTLHTLIRFALLKPEFLTYHICILGIHQSLSFYRRFSFQPVANWKDRYGNEHPLSRVELTNLEIMKCKRKLSARGVQFDFDSVEIPKAREQDNEGTQNSMATEITPL